MNYIFSDQGVHCFVNTTETLEHMTTYGERNGEILFSLCTAHGPNADTVKDLVESAGVDTTKNYYSTYDDCMRAGVIFRVPQTDLMIRNYGYSCYALSVFYALRQLVPWREFLDKHAYLNVFNDVNVTGHVFPIHTFRMASDLFDSRLKVSTDQAAHILQHVLRTLANFVAPGKAGYDDVRTMANYSPHKDTPGDPNIIIEILTDSELRHTAKPKIDHHLIIVEEQHIDPDVRRDMTSDQLRQIIVGEFNDINFEEIFENANATDTDILFLEFTKAFPLGLVRTISKETMASTGSSAGSVGSPPGWTIRSYIMAPIGARDSFFASDSRAAEYNKGGVSTHFWNAIYDPYGDIVHVDNMLMPDHDNAGVRYIVLQRNRPEYRASRYYEQTPGKRRFKTKDDDLLMAEKQPHHHRADYYSNIEQNIAAREMLERERQMANRYGRGAGWSPEVQRQWVTGPQAWDPTPQAWSVRPAGGHSLDGAVEKAWHPPQALMRGMGAKRSGHALAVRRMGSSPSDRSPARSPPRSPRSPLHGSQPHGAQTSGRPVSPIRDAVTYPLLERLVNSSARTEHDRARTEHDRARTEHDRARTEHDRARTEHDTVAAAAAAGIRMSRFELQEQRAREIQFRLDREKAAATSVSRGAVSRNDALAQFEYVPPGASPISPLSRNWDTAPTREWEDDPVPPPRRAAGPASAGPASAGPASAGPASAGPASAGPARAAPPAPSMPVITSSSRAMSVPFVPNRQGFAPNHQHGHELERRSMDKWHTAGNPDDDEFA